MKPSQLLPTPTLPRPVHRFAGWVHRTLPRTYPVLGAGIGGFATVALLVTMQGAGAPLWLVNISMLAPGLVCFVLVPSSRRRAYRWLVLLALAQVVYPWVTAPLLLVGVSWALWRTRVERPAKTTTALAVPVPVKPRTGRSRPVKSAAS